MQNRNLLPLVALTLGVSPPLFEFAQRNRRDKKPLTAADIEALAKAEEKRERKAARRAQS